VLTAFILVESTREGLAHLGSDLAAVEGVAEVYTVTGDWDFVAIVRVREHDDLAEVVTKHLTRLDGIERTQTMVAFQQFSAHDLEAMFGLGLEDKKACRWRCAPRARVPECWSRRDCPGPAVRWM
jgi:DNA-binding Lrp family transcriptional regulator